MTRKIAIVGTVGVPGSYGGFETLAENLVRYHANLELDAELAVYCSTPGAPTPAPAHFLSAELRFLPLKANGVQSIPYDIWSLFDAARRRTDVVVLLGVSGAIVLPLVRAISRMRIITNIDGIEWKREKWNGPARRFLRWSEKLAVRWSHEVIADNDAIADHVRESYGADSHVIAYGGDHAVATPPATEADLSPDLPPRYTLALCRIEPENNVEMILEAFAETPNDPLVFVGNWNSSEYGRRLRDRFADRANLWLLDPVYEPARLRAIRDRAWLYVHGHSAGGTNPALVEMMHFAIPVAAFDCSFNRSTTEGRARYFGSATELMKVTAWLRAAAERDGAAMCEIARRRYTWAEIARRYFDLAGRA